MALSSRSGRAPTCTGSASPSRASSGATCATRPTASTSTATRGGEIYVYGDEGRREIPVTGGRGVGTLEMQELHDCLVSGKPIVHDGRWGMATMEIGEAIMTSARERCEIMLTHQSRLGE
jgi:hypothetical protein